MAEGVPTQMKMAVGTVKGDYTKEGMIEWIDTKVPKVNDDEVLIKVLAVAFNRVDWLRSKGASGQKFPIKPCSDVSGTVVACGPKVQNVKVGDEVLVCVYPRDSGGECLAEYVVAKEAWVGPKPESWTHSEAAALAMTAVTAGTTVRKLGIADANKDQEIVVVGASGGVGAMVLALLKKHAFPIVAVASEKKHQFCKDVGGPTVTCVDYKKEKWEDRYKDGKKPYAVIDVSSSTPLDSYYKAVNVKGKKVLTTNTIDPSFMMTCTCLCTELCFGCKARCCSCCCCRPSYTLVLLSKNDSSETFKNCYELASSGTLKPPPIKSYPPKQVHMAYTDLANASAKPVIDMSNGV